MKRLSLPDLLLSSICPLESAADCRSLLQHMEHPPPTLPPPPLSIAFQLKFLLCMAARLPPPPFPPSPTHFFSENLLQALPIHGSRHLHPMWGLLRAVPGLCLPESIISAPVPQVHQAASPLHYPHGSSRARGRLRFRASRPQWCTDTRTRGVPPSHSPLTVVPAPAMLAPQPAKHRRRRRGPATAAPPPPEPPPPPGELGYSTG